MIVASLFFSFMGALAKYATQRLPAMEAVFFRAFVSLLLILPWMLVHKIPLLGRNKRMLLTRSLTGFIALSLNFYILDKLPLADVSILNHTSTLFVALLSAFFLKERVGLTLTIYIICAFVGAALIVKPQWGIVNVPGLLGLASGLFAAFAYISIKRLHKTDSFFTMVFYFSAVSTIGSALFMGQFISPSLPEWTALIALGLFGAVAQLLMTYSYKHTGASIVNPYSFTTVLFSSTWGAAFWGEIPDRWSIFGGLLIIACGIGIMRLKKEKGETAIEYEEDLGNLGENQA